MQKDSKIYVAGHTGLVGSAIVRSLEKQGYTNILKVERSMLDACDGAAVERFFTREKPDAMVLAAARVGGIVANDTYPGDFIGQNLLIQTNLIDAARRHKLKKVLFMASGCIYPRDCQQPIKTEYLLTGPLEKTNEWYAVAKIAGIKLCQAYRRQFNLDAFSVLPANLYGPGDNFDYETSHVTPALIRKFHDAKVTGKPSCEVWGTGRVYREMLYIDDLADASVFLLENYSGEEPVNIGYGTDMTIAELAQAVKETVGFEGNIEYNTSKPDGTPRKLLDSSLLTGMGWRPSVDIYTGLKMTYEWFLANQDSLRIVSAGQDFGRSE